MQIKDTVSDHYKITATPNQRKTTGLSFEGPQPTAPLSRSKEVI
ncbi:unnamed protein product [Acidithrix sp. C25]|nr:unnamed protein product [Acidithrix sp. C25]